MSSGGVETCLPLGNTWQDAHRHPFAKLSLRVAECSMGVTKTKFAKLSLRVTECSMGVTKTKYVYVKTLFYV